MRNLWQTVKAENSDGTFNAVIEILKNSRDKYEYDLQKADFVLEKKLSGEQMFIFDYGFVPRTITADGDPLDVIVLTQDKLSRGKVVRVEVVGLMKMLDESQEDDKIIAVIASDDFWRRRLDDRKQEIFSEIAEWTKRYKDGEETKLEIGGFASAQKAKKKIKKAIKKYEQLLAKK